jgi:hypothetical protein
MRSRLTGLLVFSVGLIGLVGSRSAAQPPGGVRDSYRKEAKRPLTEVFSLMTSMKDGVTEVKGADAAKNAEAMKQMAEFVIAPITHSELYHPSIERRSESNPNKVLNLGQAEADKTLDGVLFELGRYVVVPDARSKVPANQSEYVQEFGKALEAAIAPILNDQSNAPPPLKINAVRALAVACKSGAKAHAKTVIDLLTNDKKWPLYVQYHALKAAENLLAAGDFLELQGPNPWKHSISDADLAAIVKAVEAIIVKMNKQFPTATEPAAPAKAANPPATGKTPAAAPQGNIEAVFTIDPDVALYIRKQAVRTLSKCRVVSIAGPNKTIAARPATILARVAVGDPWFTGGATAAELADAITGLAGLNLDNSTNIELVLDAIAAGISAFGGERVRLAVPVETGSPDFKRLVAWKKLAAQLTVALNGLNQSAGKNPVALANREAINKLVSTCATYVLTPIEVEKETTTPVNQVQVDDYRKQNPPKSPLMNPTDPESKVSAAPRAGGR